MPARSAVLGLVLLAGGTAPAHAQNPPTTLRFEHLSLEQGLSQSHVNAILQDRHGFLWLGTQDGLNRYDGYRFRVFKHDERDAASLADNTVWALFEDEKGTLWVGTDGGGLDQWDPSVEGFVHHRHDEKNPKSLSSDRVRAITSTRDGALWVGTDGGLNRLDPATGAFTRFRAQPSAPDQLSSDRIRFLMEDRDGALWIATDGGGLNRLDEARVNFTVYRLDPENPKSLSDDRVRHVFQDRDGTIWVGTYEGGLDRMDGGGRFTRFRKGDGPSDLASDRVRAMLQDKSGVLWVGTDGGLAAWRPETGSFVRYRNRGTDRTSLSNDRILSLYQDRGGVLWVGTQGGGLNRWNTFTSAFSLVRTDPGARTSLSNNGVTSFASEGESTVWVGTFGGLNRIDRRTGAVKNFLHDPKDPGSLGDDRVMALMVDPHGTLWVGTYESGLHRWDAATGTFTKFLPDPADEQTLSGRGISALLRDGKGRMWVGVFRGGLNRFDPETGKATRFRHADDDPATLSADSVTCLAEDASGALWVGTDGGGFNRFDPETGKVMRYAASAEGKGGDAAGTVFAIHEDRRGDLWLGTQGGGLLRWRAADRALSRPVFKGYREREGLANNTVYGILEDDAGDIWVSTNRGLSKLDTQSDRFRNFDASHGLQSDEFNFGAYHKAVTGEMFFGGIDGFTSFLPDRVQRNANVPPLVLTQVQKVNREVKFGRDLAEVREVTLGPSDYAVSFEFAALDFAAPERNRYAYKLEGLDRDWVDAGGERRATYTNLHPGRYVFRVKGSNGDGTWNEDGLALSLVVEPPLWRTSWAYAFYVALAATAYWQVARLQARRRRRDEEYSHRLEQQVKDRTAELFQRNDELVALNKRLEDASLTDSLTGLSNRRFLMAQMPQDVAVVERFYRKLDPHQPPPLPGNRPDFALLMVDLDGLKGINDTYGHAAGDKVLVEMRGILDRACRKSDTIVRWGGDEFLVVARYVEPEVVETLAERIRRAVEEHPFDLGLGRPVHLGCSIGFALYPFVPAAPNLITWEQVGTIADRALYAAKSSGRNAWVGLLSNNRTPLEDTVHQVNQRPPRLIQEGTLEIRTSLTDPRAVVWERQVAPRSSDPLVRTPA
jgi:diguanylate cyclase (GGDEF)-like protein